MLSKAVRVACAASAVATTVSATVGRADGRDTVALLQSSVQPHIDINGSKVGLTSVEMMTKPASARVAVDDEWDMEDHQLLSVEEATSQAENVAKTLSDDEKFRLLRGSHFHGIMSGLKPDSGYYTGSVHGVPEKGVPDLKMADAGNGFRPTEAYAFGTTTSWPCLLSLASTWSRKVVSQVAGAIGEEFRGKGANVLLGPSVNVHRTARGGRNFEYLSGEDPYLGMRLTAPYVKSLQDHGVMATLKHFAFNEQETNRMLVNSVVDERTAWELYYPPFAAGVRAGAGAFMCAYNRVNGTPACANPGMLNRDLKEKMGFSGFVMTDWMASYKTFNQGLDMDMPGPEVGTPEAEATRKDWEKAGGNIKNLDEPVKRVLTSIYRLRLQDQKGCKMPCDANLHLDQTSELHSQMALHAAENAITLLKNENGVLPLTPQKGRKSIAILGSVAFAPNGSPYYSGGGSGGVPAKSVAVTGEEISKAAKELGLTVTESRSDEIKPGLAAAANAEVVVIVGGTKATEGMDRSSLNLDGGVDALIQEVAKSGKTVVVLMQTPGAVVMPWKNKVSGIANLFFGGQETGKAWARVLFGAVSPSGKLPIMMPETSQDLVPPGFITARYSEGLFTSYRNPNLKAAFPFGHGLSYTTFTYGVPQVTEQTEDHFFVKVPITNTGGMAGREVVQAYVEFLDLADKKDPLHPERPFYPKMVLKNFEETRKLEPGETQEVILHFDQLDFSTWSTQHGEFQKMEHLKVHVGASSADIRQVFELTTM